MKYALYIMVLVFCCGLSHAARNNTLGGSTKSPNRFGDQGDGTYRNPVIMAGDFADISIIRVDRDYYIPKGRIVWHSRDLVNWEPLRCETKSGGTGTIVRQGNEFRIYCGSDGGITAVRAKHPMGPWKSKVKMPGNGFDTAYLEGLDGKNYLIGGGNVGHLYELAPDGMSIVNTFELGYEGWPIPEDWDVAGFFLEGWNTITKDGYYYVLAAQGGTAGPPTSHMCVAARSKNPTGPWENSPYNPIVHTYSKEEAFWSKGQGVLIDTPEGEWYILYHAYLKGQRYLGRQICLEPIEWTEDGWFRIPEGQQADQPLPKPKGGEAVPNGFVLEDDFSGPDLNIKWTLANDRYRFVEGGLELKATSDFSPMTMPVVYPAYEFVVEMTVPDGVEGGAVVYYSEKAKARISVKGDTVSARGQINGGKEQKTFSGERIFLKVVCSDGLVRFYYGPDGVDWKRFGNTAVVSHYDRNSFGEANSVAPGIYARGDGSVVIHSFQLRGLD